MADYSQSESQLQARQTNTIQAELWQGLTVALYNLHMNEQGAGVLMCLALALTCYGQLIRATKVFFAWSAREG